MSNQSIIEFDEMDYQRMIRLFKEIKERINELEGIISIEEREEPPLKYRLLKRINEEGGVVTKQRFNELAEEVGYPDPRGPQGLFAYGGRYVTQIAGDRVAITTKGTQLLQEVGLIQ